MVHAASAIAVRDGLRRGLGWRPDPATELRALRLGIVAIMAVSYLVAVSYEGSLVKLLLTTYGAVVQFMPGIVAALYLRRASGVGVAAGMIVGSLVTAMFVLEPAWRPWAVHAGLYGLVANVAVLTLLSWWYEPPEDADAFLRVARRG